MFSEADEKLALVYGAIFLAVLLHFWHRRRFFKLSRAFPGPVEVPFLGVLPRLINPKEILLKMRLVLEIYDTHTIFSYFGPQPVLYTVDPALMEKVFASSELLNKADILYSPLSNLFGDGLFSSKGLEQVEAAPLLPLLRTFVLRTFLPIFNRNARDFMKKLDKMVGQGPQSFPDVLQRLTLTTAVETILGKQMKEGSEVDDKLAHHYSSVMKSTFLMILLNVVKLSGLAKRLNFYNSRKAVFDFVDNLLLNKASKTFADNGNIVSEKPSGEDDDIYLTSRKSIFIDEALKIYQRGQFDWKDITDESNSIIFAAFDTTANTMFCALCFLAMHPTVQEKLFEEIVSIFPDRDFGYVDYEHVEACVYLDMVINETLRLAPSVPNIARGVTQDTKLTEDLVLPKGLLVFLNIFGVHRNTAFWGPNANEFNPENFLPENVAQRHPFSFVPFSKGMRNCIGGRYALMAIKVFLLHTLRNYRFSTKFKFDDMEFLNYITLKCINVPLLEVHKREQ